MPIEGGAGAPGGEDSVRWAGVVGWCGGWAGCRVAKCASIGLDLDSCSVCHPRGGRSATGRYSRWTIAQFYTVRVHNRPQIPRSQIGCALCHPPTCVVSLLLPSIVGHSGTHYLRSSLLASPIGGLADWLAHRNAGHIGIYLIRKGPPGQKSGGPYIVMSTGLTPVPEGRLELPTSRL